MKDVRVKKADLLTTLRENRRTHKKDFDIAWDAFREKAQANFEARLKQIKRLKRAEHIDLWVNLEVPVDHTEEYDRAIEMLKWEIYEEVELSEAEFRQYVQDRWSWKTQFEATSTYYTGMASPSKA